MSLISVVLGRIARFVRREPATLPRETSEPKPKPWIEPSVAGARRRMKSRRQVQYRWAYFDPSSGVAIQANGGPTRSEGRGAVKRKLGLRRLPAGIWLDKVGALHGE
jgi:hypothetical protein